MRSHERPPGWLRRRRDNNLERKETVVERAEEEEGRGGEGPALSNDKTTIILVTRDIAAGRLCLDPERPSRTLEKVLPAND